MQFGRRWPLACSLFSIGLAAISIVSPLAAEGYNIGHTWARSHDWGNLGPADDGSDSGNPTNDKCGEPVWEYRSVTGGTGSEGGQAWFGLPSTSMVWRSASVNGEPPHTWGVGTGIPIPYVSREALSHSTAAHHLTAFQIWNNTSAGETALRIHGNVRLVWEGSDHSSGETELVVGRMTAGTGWETIKLLTLTRPAMGPPPSEISVPLDLYLDAGPGAQVALSLRIVSPAGDLTVTAHDRLSYEVVAADIDRDGLSNEAESLRHGTHPLLPDSDHDGWDDRVELEFRGNSASAAEGPVFGMDLTSDPANSGMHIAFPAARSKLYFVEKSNNLATWVPWLEDIRGDGGLHTITVPVEASAPVFFRTVESPVGLDPAVAAYKQASGISLASAGQINTMLAELRRAGMDPAFFWVGGSAYNDPTQSLAVIGGGGQVVGAGVGNPWGETAAGCRFNRGKFLQFDQPPSLRSERVQSLAVAVWFDELSYTEQSAVLNTFDSTARGFRISQTATGEARLASFVSSAGTNNADVYPVPTFMRSAKNRFCYYQFEELSASVTRVAAMTDDDSYVRDIGPLYNNFGKIRIGGESTSVLPSAAPWAFANCRVSAVVIAPTGPKPSFVTTPSGSTVVAGSAIGVSDAPFNGGILPARERGRIVTLGDSTTAARWNSIAFSTAPDGGAWVNNALIEDLAVGGTSMDFHISLTSDIKRALNRGSASPAYFVYTPEEILGTVAVSLGLAANDSQGWYDLMEAWLKDIERETGCQIVLCSYIKGNTASSQVGLQNRDVVKEMVGRNRWNYVPFREDPHSQVWTGSVPGSYGFYMDSIHQTAAGSRIQAEIFAAALPNPHRPNAPRLDLNHVPSVIGAPEVGELLECVPGRWFGGPGNFGYQWLRDLVPIVGATGQGYMLAPDDLGKRIACRVTASKAGEPSASFTASPTVPVTN
jgi:hypothetical protein